MVAEIEDNIVSKNQEGGKIQQSGQLKTIYSKQLVSLVEKLTLVANEREIEELVIETLRKGNGKAKRSPRQH